jgi:hypothetical protein
MPQPYPQNSNSPEGLVSKSEANYRPAESPLQTCEKCANFSGTTGCSRVEGRITPSDVCDLYVEDMNAGFDPMSML